MSDAIPLSDRPLWALSWLIWRIVPGRASTKMAGFSHTERGSGLDMLEAVESTKRRDLRRRYYRHALDELRHSRLFAERARILATSWSRADAVLRDSGFIQAQGINEKHTLFEKFDEIEFLAFVWVHESQGARQFALYADLLSDDQDTAVMFDEIARDERFHISYSKAELDRQAEKGHRAAVRNAVWRVRWRRVWQGWLRFSHNLGTFMSGLWLSILYVFFLGPFSIIARLTERQSGGLQPTEPGRTAVVRAHEMA